MRLRFNPWPCSVGQGSGVALSCGVGCRRGWDPALLWLWHRPAAMAPIRPLAWELPYATRAAQEMAKRQKNKKRAEYFINWGKTQLLSLIFKKLVEKNYLNGKIKILIAFLLFINRNQRETMISCFVFCLHVFYFPSFFLCSSLPSFLLLFLPSLTE